MIDWMGLFFVILIFAPFLFIMVPALLYYKLTGRWWKKPEVER